MTMTGGLSVTTYDDGKKVMSMQVLSGGGESVGATIVNTLTMTRTGDCED